MLREHRFVAQKRHFRSQSLRDAGVTPVVTLEIADRKSVRRSRCA
jgi:hypothetical protein